MEFCEYPDFHALCPALADRLAEACRSGVERHGAVTLALAGGSTPLPLYRRLAATPLPWPRITLLPGDERWVATDHAGSNLRALREAFATTDARFESLVPAHPGPEPTLDAAMHALSSVAMPPAACVLGMGADGHFASLFPGAPELPAALDPHGDEPLVVIRPDPPPESAPFARISLTLAAIAASREIHLVLRGARKREVLRRARDAAPDQLPIAALLAHPGLPLHIHWSP